MRRLLSGSSSTTMTASLKNALRRGSQSLVCRRSLHSSRSLRVESPSPGNVRAAAMLFAARGKLQRDLGHLLLPRSIGQAASTSEADTTRHATVPFAQTVTVPCHSARAEARDAPIDVAAPSAAATRRRQARPASNATKAPAQNFRVRGEQHRNFLWPAFIRRVNNMLPSRSK